MEATLRNMMKFDGDPSVMGYSPLTGEMCGVNPGDYFWLNDLPDSPLVDSEGNPMILVRDLGRELEEL